MSKELIERNRKIYLYRTINNFSFSHIGKIIKKPGEKPLNKSAVFRIVKREEKKLKLKTVDN